MITARHPCPPILQYPSKPGKFIRAMLNLKLQEQPTKEDRVIYVTYPENGEVWAERWVGDDNGNLDETIITQSLRDNTQKTACRACRYDWEDFVSVVLKCHARSKNTRGTVKVP